MPTVQILHASDLEGGLEAVSNAPNFAAIIETFEDQAEADGIESILISGGDNYIPGPFFNAAQFVGDDVFIDVYSQLFAEDLAANPDITIDVGDGRGNADIAIMNVLGFDASAIGNHEFDNGPDAFGGLILQEVDGTTVESFGALFPYLSTNLDFSGEPALADAASTDIQNSSAFTSLPSEITGGDASDTRIAQATIVGEGENAVGVIGATTQRVGQISSTGGVEDTTGGDDDMAALAAVLQPVVDQIVASGVDQVVLTSHLQDINLEQELAGLLSGVDVIIASGSDTILANEGDRLRPDDEAADTYPILTTDADGTPVAIVSTDGEYSYVGRLVVEFDDNGVIVPDSIVAGESASFATDEQGVLDVTGADSLDAAIAGSEKATLVQTLTTAVQDEVTAADGNVFGDSAVFLDGRRETVRTEESNFGNLTADANLAAAQAVDPTVQVAFKNGGGIRAAIGEVDGETGELLPTQANPLSGKEEGQVSELDIQNALRFNNTLALVTLSSEDIKIVLEHAVSRSGPDSTPGQFPQIGGIAFSWDPAGTAQVLDENGNVTTPGSRVQSVALIDENGATTEVLVENGEVVEGAPGAIRVTTLNFLVGDEGDLIGGDGYPFQALGEDIAFVTEDGGVTSDFEAENLLGEQEALQQFLADRFPVETDAAFSEPEVAPALDSRIQNLSERSDTVAAPAGSDELQITLLRTFQGESDPENEDSPEGASEVVSFDDGLLYVTNGNLQRIDIFDAETLAATIDLSFIDGFNGVQSVAAKNGLVAAAVDIEPDEDGTPNPGVVAIFDAGSLEVLEVVEAGFLPDQVSFTPDGGTILLANEGEFNSESDLSVDAPGSVTVVDVRDTALITSETVDFSGAADLIASAASQGLRLSPDADPVNDLEPEYIATSPDGSVAYVSLQENNAFAVLDLETLEFTDILSQDLLDHSGGTYSLETVEFPDLPLLGTDATGLDIDLGGFSGLWFDGRTDDGDLKFLVVPDRGPNGSEVVDGARTFNLPDYQARVIEFSVNEETGEATILDETFFTDGAGNPITGLPNIEGFDEIPVDAAGNALPYDPFGADMEGIVRAPDGAFWTVDEYRPAIYRFDENGALTDRFVAEGTSLLGDEPQPEGTFGTETLPEEYAERRTNRGFEAMALDEENGVLYAFIQTPLANPDREASDTSDVIRILGIDVTSGEPVEEYVYLLEDPSPAIRAGGRVDKIGDAVYLGDGRIAVIERDANFGTDADKNVYEIDLSAATNLITDPPSQPLDGTLEQQTNATLADVGIVPVAKRKLFGLPEIGYAPSDKPEGLALTDDGRLAVLNDNDFGIEDSSGLVPQLGLISQNGDAGFDATDDDVIDILPRDTLGMRMADAIATAEIGGQTYIFSANEGDGRGDGLEFDDDDNFVGRIPNGDEARGSEVAAAGLLDEEAFPEVVIAEALEMSEAQEVAETPVPDTAATGSFTATLDETAMTVTVSGTFSDLSAPLFDVGGEDGFGNPESAVHVHLGAAGTNGPIFFNTTVTDNGDGSGSFTGTAPVTDEQAATFRNDGYYVNLHTEAFNGGELRGQIDLPDVTTFKDVAEGSLSRLTVSTIDGDTDGDGDIDQLYSFGSRSFTIFDSAGTVVFDSGSDFEEIIANIAPERFNDDDGELGQNRSDAKGPEPEAITVGTVGQQTYAFIGLERDSGIMVYNVSEPVRSEFVTYLDGFATGNIGPEVITFIEPGESTTGNAQIAVSYEISGTTAIYDLGRLPAAETTEDYYSVALGRSTDIGGFDFWSDIIDFGNTERLVADEFNDSAEFQRLISGLSTEDGIDLVFNNGLARDANDAEQDFYAPIVEEDGYGELFFDIVNDELLA